MGAGQVQATSTPRHLASPTLGQPWGEQPGGGISVHVGHTGAWGCVVCVCVVWGCPWGCATCLCPHVASRHMEAQTEPWGRGRSGVKGVG